MSANGESVLYDLMLDCVSQMEKNRQGWKLHREYTEGGQSWLNHNGKDIRRKIKIRGARDTPSLKDERVLQEREPKTDISIMRQKARVACVLVAHSGNED